MELISRAGQHFIDWWKTIDDEDDPRELVALESARIILHGRAKDFLVREDRLLEYGRLTGVLLRLIHQHIPDSKVKEMRDVMVHDIELRKVRQKQDKYWPTSPPN